MLFLKNGDLYSMILIASKWGLSFACSLQQFEKKGKRKAFCFYIFPCFCLNCECFQLICDANQITETPKHEEETHICIIAVEQSKV